MQTKTPHPRRWTILALILAAEIMDMLDSTIVNVAAPTIHSDLHAGASALQWILGGYALAFAVGLIAGGRLGDIYGRKRLFVIGSAGFVLFSTLCALAADPAMLIACRLLQGTAAAALIPQGLGIMHEVFDSEELTKAFTVFGPVIGLSAVLGPILGGVLVSANAFGTGWRLIFLINLPLGLVAALGAARLMPEARAERRPTLDVTGTLIAAAAMGLLVYPLIQGRTAGWPAWTFAMMGASVAAFAALIPWSLRERRRGRDALIEPSIFRHRAYSAGLCSMLVFFGAQTGLLLVITLYLQLGEHFSAIHSGATLAPFALGAAVGAALGGAVLVERFGRPVLQAGALVLGGGAWWLHAVVASHGLHTGTGDVAGPLAVAGIGMGALIAPLFGFVLASVSGDEVGSAAGVLNAVQQLAGAIGVATIGTLFFSTLTDQGFVTAFEHSVMVMMLSTIVLVVLLGLLPMQQRDEHGPAAETVAGGAAQASPAPPDGVAQPTSPSPEVPSAT